MHAMLKKLCLPAVRSDPVPGPAFNVIVQCVSHRFNVGRQKKKKWPGQRTITQSIKPTAMDPTLMMATNGQVTQTKDWWLRLIEKPPADTRRWNVRFTFALREKFPRLMHELLLL
ncbi:hypothetical protein CRENBAI_001353 [Crenichthys baileyi]|uniref:Uncharacterized protein n=1 Tax=Crenichthys baileyi TaxID=28760 RepID=A0AAV9QT11_9TELE